MGRTRPATLRLPRKVIMDAGVLPASPSAPLPAVLEAVHILCKRRREPGGAPSRGMRFSVHIEWATHPDPSRPLYAPTLAEWEQEWYHEYDSAPSPSTVLRALARHVWGISGGDPYAIAGQDPLPGL